MVRNRKIEEKTLNWYRVGNSSCFLWKFFIQDLLFKRLWETSYLLLFALVESPQDRRWEGLCLWAISDKVSWVVVLSCASYGPGAMAEASGARRACGGTGFWGNCPGAVGCLLMGWHLPWLLHGGLPPRSLNLGLNPQALNFLTGHAALVHLCAVGSDRTRPHTLCCFLREGHLSF